MFARRTLSLQGGYLNVLYGELVNDARYHLALGTAAPRAAMVFSSGSELP